MRLRTVPPLAVVLAACVIPAPAKGAALGHENRLGPAVAFDGSNDPEVAGSRPTGAAADVFGARVNEAGAVLDPGGIPISGAPGDQRAAAVAFDGRNFVVVWDDQRSTSSGPDIYSAAASARPASSSTPAGSPSRPRRGLS